MGGSKIEAPMIAPQLRRDGRKRGSEENKKQRKKIFKLNRLKKTEAKKKTFSVRLIRYITGLALTKSNTNTRNSS